MRSIALVLVALLTVAGTARADGPHVVIESYSGPRPANASQTLQTVLDELVVKHKWAAGVDLVGRKFETSVSRTSSTTAGLPGDFATQVDVGHRAWIAGKFDEAMKTLAPMVNAAYANPAAFARDPTLRDKLFKAQIALALSQQRTGDPGSARTTLAEVVRSYDTSLPRSVYGPEAFELFEQIKKDISTAGRGTLAVKETSGGAIYVNERYVDIGEIKIKLLPGEYRVVAKLAGNQMSRAHRVVVNAAEETRVTIDAAFDTAVRSAPGWVGLEFATPELREKNEARFAAVFANAIGASAIAVVGIDQVKGKAVVFGALVNLSTGADTRRASIALEPEPGAETLRGLARFLLGEPAPPGLEVQVSGDVKAAKSLPPGAERPDLLEQRDPPAMWGGWKYIVGSVGVAAILGGAIALSYNDKCIDGSAPCANKYETKTTGVAVLTGGAVLTGVAVYLFVRELRGRKPSSTAYLVPTDRGALAGYAATF